MLRRCCGDPAGEAGSIRNVPGKAGVRLAWKSSIYDGDIRIICGARDRSVEQCGGACAAFDGGAAGGSNEGKAWADALLARPRGVVRHGAGSEGVEVARLG